MTRGRRPSLPGMTSLRTTGPAAVAEDADAELRVSACDTVALNAGDPGERVCTDQTCEHQGSGRGRYRDPCPHCGYHDCDLDCGQGSDED